MDRAAKLLVAVHLPNGVVQHSSFSEVGFRLRIGSDPACQIVVPVAGLPVYAEVIAKGPSLFIVDVSNGSLIFGGQPTSQLRLPFEKTQSVALHGIGVRIDLTCKTQNAQLVAPCAGVGIQSKPPAVRAVADQLPAEPGPGGHAVVTLIAPGFHRDFTLTDGHTATIGRSRTCEFPVPENIDGVSRAHARLSWTNGWLVLQDLGSTNATWINNHKISRVVLRASEQHHVELGKPGALLSVRIAGDVTAAIASAELEAKQIQTWLGEERDATLRKTQNDRLVQQRHQIMQQQTILEQLDARRIAAEAAWETEWRLLDDERRRLQQERRILEDESLFTVFGDDEATDPTLVALVDVDTDVEWLKALPERIREVFRNLAEHGQVNEEEATRILGGPRQFRQFCLQFEFYRSQCPFSVRIETSGEVKCYVRDDR